MPTIITQELIDQILKMHKSGMTGVSIAKQLGIGKTTVNKYIRIYSDDYKVVNTDKFTNDFVDRMTQEYKAGKTVNELATKYHVSASSLATYIYRNVKGVESQGKKVTSKKENTLDKVSEKKENTLDKVSEKKENTLDKVSEKKENTLDKVSEKKENTNDNISDNNISETTVQQVPLTDDYNKRRNLVEEYLQEERNIDIMVSLFKTGTSLTKIAKLTGLSRSTVTRAIYERLGLKQHPVIKRDIKPKDAIVVAIKKPVWTLEDKIAYCNEKYGEGKWRFLTKEEVLEYFKADGIIA